MCALSPKLIAISLLASLIAPSQSLSREENKIDPLKEIATGLNVSIFVSTDAFSSDQHVSGTKVNSATLKHYLPILISEFKLYKPAVISKIHLRRVVLCQGLSCSGQRRYAIPHDSDHTLYIDITAGFDDKQYQIRAIHHELFHMIDQYDDGSVIEDYKWAKLNSSSFRYGKNRDFVHTDPTAGTLRNNLPGFLDTYSQSAVPEDKAEIYSYMITDYATVKKRAESDPIIKAKVTRIQELLHDFDSTFDDQFWLRVSKRAH